MWPLTLLNICLLRANPQDLPTSTVLTLAMVGMYYVLDVVTSPAKISFANALAAATVDTFLLVALTQLALTLRHVGARLHQTLTALTGTGALLMGAAFLIGIWVPQDASLDVVGLVALLCLLAIYGHILRHALDISYPMAVMATSVYVILCLLLVVAPFLISPDAS